MAMGNAFDREELQAPMAEINTTPLVDVMLVLLVIFLVTAPMLSHSVNLKLPSETTTQVKNEKVSTLSIDAQGQYYWDDAPISESELAQRMQSVAAADPTQPVHVRADTGVAYGKVSHALAIASRSGLTNIGFITQPE